MRNIIIPETVQDYAADVHERLLPATILTDNDFYRRLIGWTLVERTPIIYEQDDPSEYANFSINFNWLLARDYSRSALGDAAIVGTMYGLHEMAHMTHRLPTRLDTVTAAQYAEDFTSSEYRASNETEILLHYRVPAVRPLVLQNTRIAFDVMRDKGLAQPSAKLLAALRPLAVEHDTLAGFFSDSPADQAVYDRFKQFDGNRRWARERYNAIRPFFAGSFEDDWAETTGGLTDDEYEATISNYQPRYDQAAYEANIIRNVRLGFAMCGLAVPELVSFVDARTAAQDLEGCHAVTQP